MTERGQKAPKSKRSINNPISGVKKAADQTIIDKIISWLIYTVSISIIAPYGIKFLILLVSSSLAGKTAWQIVVATFSDGGLGIIAVVIAAEAMGKLIRYRGETQQKSLLDFLGLFIVISIIAASLMFGLQSIDTTNISSGALTPIDIGKVTAISLLVFFITLWIGIITIIITKGSE
jgi:hypothetical protein